jgi:hypothetical protein
MKGMKQAVLCLLVLTSACGVEYAPRPLGASHCEFNGGAIWAYSENPGLRCEAVEAAFDAAITQLEAAGVASRQELEGAFEGIAIEVRPGIRFDWDGPVTGVYVSKKRTVILTSDGSGLLHELLHCWEDSQGIDDTGAHPSWRDKGYVVLDVLFSQKAQPLL